jgi:hypothetical protein
MAMDVSGIKEAQRKMWTIGDYPDIATKPSSAERGLAAGRPSGSTDAVLAHPSRASGSLEYPDPEWFVAPTHLSERSHEISASSNRDMPRQR